MNVDQLDQLFEQSLGNFEVVPRSEIWDEIEKKIIRQKRKTRLLWLLFGGASLVLSGILLCKYLENNPEKIKDKIHTEPMVVEKENPQKNEIVIDSIRTDSILASNTLSLKKIEPKSLSQKERIKVKKKFYTPKNKRTPNRLLGRTWQLSSKIDIPNSLILKNKKQEKGQTKKKKKVTTEPKKEEKKFKKLWYIQPSLGILNNQTFNDFSSFDDRLNGSLIEGTTTFSYGIRVRWQLNPRWSLQSGIFFQRIQYNTNNIRVFSGGSFGNLTNVNSSGNSFLFQRNSDDANAILSNPAVTLLSENAILQQQFEYVEFPFEVTYAFYKKRNIDLGVTAGLSYLYLNENKIDVVSAEISDFVGEAINLNDRNVSSNLGLDFVYRLNKRWAFNVSSAAKFHLKTYSKNSTRFTQYSIGVYTGILYKF